MYGPIAVERPKSTLIKLLVSVFLSDRDSSEREFHLVGVGPVHPAGIRPFIHAFLDDGISRIPALLPLLISGWRAAIKILRSILDHSLPLTEVLLTASMPPSMAIATSQSPASLLPVFHAIPVGRPAGIPQRLVQMASLNV